MNNSKSAILFLGVGKVPKTFQEYKKYELGTEYVVLFDKKYEGLNEEPHCMLCRILDKKEISSFDKKVINTLVLKDGGDIRELDVIIITSALKSIEEADDIISSYKEQSTNLNRQKAT